MDRRRSFLIFPNPAPEGLQHFYNTLDSYARNDVEWNRLVVNCSAENTNGPNKWLFDFGINASVIVITNDIASLLGTEGRPTFTVGLNEAVTENTLPNAGTVWRCSQHPLLTITFLN